MDHGTLSQILTGKRKISRRNFQKLAEALELSPELVARLQMEVDLGLESYSTLEEEALAELGHWSMSALCELMRLPGFISDPRWMAEQLEVSESEIESALRALSQTGQIRLHKGRWEPVEMNTTTLSGTHLKNLNLAEVVRRGQRGFMEKQLKAFEEKPLHEMSHYGLTVAVDTDRLPEFREKFVQFLREFSTQTESASAEPKAVYRLNLSFFPVSKTCSDSHNLANFKKTE